MIEPRLSRLGFLDPKFEGLFGHLRGELASCIDFGHRLTQLGHDLLFEAAFDEDDPQQLLIVCLLQRALTSLQGILILSQRGLRAESIVIARTLLEIMFRIVAIAKDADVALDYIKQDERYRLKILNKFSKLSASAIAGVDLPKLEELRAKVKRELHEREVSERTVEWFAEKAGLLDFYVSVYAVFSSTAHVNVRDLEQEFAVDANGRLLGFRYLPRFESLPSVVLAAFEAFILCVRAMSSILTTSRTADIDRIHDEFKVLVEEIKGANEA
jgi:hypothetical protein